MGRTPLDNNGNLDWKCIDGSWQYDGRIYRRFHEKSVSGIENRVDRLDHRVSMKKEYVIEDDKRINTL